MRDLREAHSLASKPEEIVLALNSFGLRLLRQESARNLKQNLFVSPISIFLALAMTEEGAAGKTKTSIREVLALPSGVSEETMNASMSVMLESLRARKGVELSIANALWADARVPLAADFVRRCKDTYDAEANEIDFTQPSAAAIINHWVSEKTKGKISAIADSDNVRNAIVILANAIYFKGKFRHQFMKVATQPGTFHLVDGREKRVPMMRRTFPLGSYIRGRNCEIAVLPYEDSGIALYALLPSKGATPEKVVSEASVESFDEPQDQCDLHVIMPRFTLDFRSSLKKSLEQMGMVIAFRPGADFTTLGSSHFFVDDVLHKARLELDEEGTVAAAVTTNTICLAALFPEPIDEKTLVFDRPFGLLLRDTVTGAIIFAGVVYEPSDSHEECRDGRVL